MWVLAAAACAAGLALLPLLTRWERMARVRHWRGRGAAPSQGAAWAAEVSLGDAGARGRRPRVHGPREGRGGGAPPLSMLVTEVSARLGAGASVPEAWARSWERHPGLGPLGGSDGAGVPRGLAALAHRPRWRDLRLPGRWGPGRLRRRGEQRGSPASGGGRGGGGWGDAPPAGDDTRAVAPGVWDVLRAGRAPARAERASARALVTACRFTAHLGAPLAGVLDLVADGVDGAAAAEDARRAAGSGPRTSTRVLLALPLLGVAAGEALGAGPMAFLLGGGVGTVCLVVGVACQVGGHLVSRLLTRRAEGTGAMGRVDPAILCDLAVAGLESGASVPTTLEALGAAAELPELGRIGRELLLGVPWGTAWDPHPEEAGDLGDALSPAWTDGTAPVPLLRRAAAGVRSRRMARATEEAERLAVRLVVPVAALLLPGFVALGVVPVLAHLASSGFGAPV